MKKLILIISIFLMFSCTEKEDVQPIQQQETNISGIWSSNSFCMTGNMTISIVQITKKQITVDGHILEFDGSLYSGKIGAVTHTVKTEGEEILYSQQYSGSVCEGYFNK